MSDSNENLVILMNTTIPKKPVKRPRRLKKLKFVFLKIEKEISNVNNGIVPIRVDATILSTCISLRLIKLNGKTFPNNAIPNRRNLSVEISF